MSEIPNDVPPPGRHSPVMPAKKRDGWVRRVVGWRFATGRASDLGGTDQRCGYCFGAIRSGRKHFCRFKTQRAYIPNTTGIYKPEFRWFKVG